MPERITVAEFHLRLKAQGVSDRTHFAFLCPICKTPQSMASLMRAGANADMAERMIGFACEGRLTDAGPAAMPGETSAKARKRREVRGCNWTLGGLFRLHELEVITDDGAVNPRFVIADAEQARSLEAAFAPTAA